MRRKSWKKYKENPIPRVPPVTRAVVPLRDHLDPLLLLVVFAIVVFATLGKCLADTLYKCIHFEKEGDIEVDVIDVIGW
jgi:hypothetical protein